MRFLVDAQLPAALARRLVEIGHDAEHVEHCGLAAASDTVIWRHAIRVSAIIITKDEDFAIRRAMTGDGPRVVWIRIPNTRRSALLAWFDAALPGILDALDRGEGLVELV